MRVLKGTHGLDPSILKKIDFADYIVETEENGQDVYYAFSRPNIENGELICDFVDKLILAENEEDDRQVYIPLEYVDPDVIDAMHERMIEDDRVIDRKLDDDFSVAKEWLKGLKLGRKNL